MKSTLKQGGDPSNSSKIKKEHSTLQHCTQKNERANL